MGAVIAWTCNKVMQKGQRDFDVILCPIVQVASVLFITDDPTKATLKDVIQTCKENVAEQLRQTFDDPSISSQDFKLIPRLFQPGNVREDTLLHSFNGFFELTPVPYSRVNHKFKFDDLVVKLNRDKAQLKEDTESLKSLNNKIIKKCKALEVSVQLCKKNHSVTPTQELSADLASLGVVDGTSTHYYVCNAIQGLLKNHEDKISSLISDHAKEREISQSKNEALISRHEQEMKALQVHHKEEIETLQVKHEQKIDDITRPLFQNEALLLFNDLADYFLAEYVFKGFQEDIDDGSISVGQLVNQLRANKELGKYGYKSADGSFKLSPDDIKKLHSELKQNRNQAAHKAFRSKQDIKKFLPFLPLAVQPIVKEMSEFLVKNDAKYQSLAEI